MEVGKFYKMVPTEQKAEIERLKKAEKCLDDQLAIQLAEPSIKTDAYMAGLANGMLLAKANFGGDYNPISYKDSRLAEQTERVRKLTDALNGGCQSHNPNHYNFIDHGLNKEGLMQIFCEDCRDEALNQERLGDGK